MRRQDDPPLDYDVREFPDEPDLKDFQPPKPIEPEPKQPLIALEAGLSAEEIDRRITRKAEELAVKMTRDNLTMLRMVGAVNEEKVADMREAHHDPRGWAKKQRLLKARANLGEGASKRALRLAPASLGQASLGTGELADFEMTDPAKPRPRDHTKMGKLRMRARELGISPLPFTIRETEDAIADKEAQLEAAAAQKGEQENAGQRPAA